MAAAVAAVFFAGPAYAKEKTLPEGLFVGEAALGGMTEEEAREAIKAEERRLASRKITLNIDGNMASATAEELGLSWENPEAADEAMKQAAGGNLVERYMIRKDMRSEEHTS